MGNPDLHTHERNYPADKEKESRREWRERRRWDWEKRQEAISSVNGGTKVK
jgi:hypothetical protein